MFTVLHWVVAPVWYWSCRSRQSVVNCSHSDEVWLLRRVRFWLAPLQPMVAMSLPLCTLPSTKWRRLQPCWTMHGVLIYMLTASPGRTPTDRTGTGRTSWSMKVCRVTRCCTPFWSSTSKDPLRVIKGHCLLLEIFFKGVRWWRTLSASWKSVASSGTNCAMSMIGAVAMQPWWNGLQKVSRQWGWMTHHGHNYRGKVWDFGCRVWCCGPSLTRSCSSWWRETAGFDASTWSRGKGLGCRRDRCRSVRKRMLDPCMWGSRRLSSSVLCRSGWQLFMARSWRSNWKDNMQIQRQSRCSPQCQPWRWKDEGRCWAAAAFSVWRTVHAADWELLRRSLPWTDVGIASM